MVYLSELIFVDSQEYLIDQKDEILFVELYHVEIPVIKMLLKI
jgi:hypothetical protein